VISYWKVKLELGLEFELGFVVWWFVVEQYYLGEHPWWYP